jgi:hypothetical protein
MHDSNTPLGGLVPMWLMQLGEVVVGGVGSGLYGLVAFAIVAVFVAGLMVGRTPEYLGKKIEAYEMKMASIMILIPCAVVLIGTAVAVVTPQGKATIFNPAGHGFSEVLYAFSSAGNNNGSAFAGLGANTPFYNTALGLAMFFARFWLAIPILAIAGSLAQKKPEEDGPGQQWHAADPHSALRSAADQRRADCGRLDVPSGARARTNCRTFATLHAVTNRMATAQSHPHHRCPLFDPAIVRRALWDSVV